MKLQQLCLDFEAKNIPSVKPPRLPWQVRALAARYDLPISRAALVAELAGIPVEGVRHEFGLKIETIHEAHEGTFSGTHARYVLRSQVRLTAPCSGATCTESTAT